MGAENTGINILDAKNQFSRLVARAEHGERITISRNGRPVARLVPYRADRPERKPGAWAGRIKVEPGFDDLSAADEADWYGA